MNAHWSFWIDVGGTFTDCVARAPDGRLVCEKILNTPEGDAPIIAIRRIMGLGDEDPIGEVEVRLGTTRGTNALLERKGTPVGFITTAGFGDLLEIGTQARPNLFALDIRKPPPLYTTVVEIDERIANDGRVLRPLDEAAVRDHLAPLLHREVRSLAVCLINAFTNDAHERAVERIAAGMGFAHVSVSTRLSPTIRALDRGDTAVLDAYLSPVIRDYLDALQRRMPAARLRVMTSAGGLVSPDRFAGKDSLLSGPAGGVVGFAAVAERAGFERAIGFDMGGTSTDVARWDGSYEYEYSGEKAGVRCVAPMYAIETVAAGGGSICRFDGTRLTVGPDSAGADPGPACYGRGGPLTLTDVNLFEGRIDESRFPFPLDRRAAADRLTRIATLAGMPPRRAAEGITQIANLCMATAIKRISAARGYDPADHVLVAFGGAAAQHACGVARLLGIRCILLHPLAGVLSAYGLGMADVTRFAERSVLRTLSEQTLRDLESEFAELETVARCEVAAEGVPEPQIEPPRRLLDLRYAGEDAPITVPAPGNGDWRASFEAAHIRCYGHRHGDRPIEIATMRVEALGHTPRPRSAPATLKRRPSSSRGLRTMNVSGHPRSVPCFAREALVAGDSIEGPAIITEPMTTVVIDPHCTAIVTERDDMLITLQSDRVESPVPTTRDPARLELFNNHFTHIATQMGVTLQKTALSVNIKERLDFSCAILDARGDLVVNAPHIPVHLGAMSEAVKALIDTVDDIRPGDVYASNDPDLGGSHLPDVTVITPAFDGSGRELRFFAASRAHHAEIGGQRPGSAYPFARNLAEEGVVLRNLRIARGETFDEVALRRALGEGPYPSRSPDENVGDIRAAIAANRVGQGGLDRLIEADGWGTVEAYMGHIRAAAAEMARHAIAGLPQGTRVFEDALDGGDASARIRIKLTVRGDALTVDFTGTGAVNPNSLNANRAVVQAAILYCLRCLIGRDIPLNSGVLEPVGLILPECMLNPPACPDPERHAAVVGGNVELSQKVVDVFFGALGVVAASQGTMNNLVFGHRSFGYYETICGGAGAGPGFDGATAVHTHMTNTRITDVEVMEHRYPVRVRRFAIRRGSGGAGMHHGGDGVIREIEFLSPVEVSILSQRRTTRPFGLNGGEPGAPGQNLFNGSEVGPMAQIRATPGDVLTILTPGGGGFSTAARA